MREAQRGLFTHSFALLNDHRLAVIVTAQLKLQGAYGCVPAAPGHAVG